MKLLIASLILSLAIQDYTGRSIVIDLQAPVVSDSIYVQDSISSITNGAVGDLMCHSTQYNYARTGHNTFNFDPCFTFVKDLLESPDLMIGNLETTLAGERIHYSGYPQFNTPDDFAASLARNGFDMLVTANNHSNDTGTKGIVRTLDVLDSLDLMHTGTYASEDERDEIVIHTIEGISLAVLAYTYSTNGLELPADKPWLVNPIDSGLIASDIGKARDNGAEIVVTFFHFGNEYQREPDAYQRRVAGWAAEEGADIILGSHPHVVQPAEWFLTTGATLDTGFIAWSLGNFISNQPMDYTDEGLIVHLTLTKNHSTGKITLSDCSYYPTWVYRGTDSKDKIHRVIPVPFDGAAEHNVLQQFSKEMTEASAHTDSQMQALSGMVLDW